MRATPSSARPFFLVQPVPEGRLEFLERSSGVREIFPIAILAVADAGNSDSADPFRKAKVWEDLIADIERAMVADVSCGGLATDVRLRAPRPMAGFGSDTTVIVEQIAEIRLYRQYGQP